MPFDFNFFNYIFVRFTRLLLDSKTILSNFEKSPFGLVSLPSNSGIYSVSVSTACTTCLYIATEDGHQNIWLFECCCC